MVVFADTCGEYDAVEAVHCGGISTDIFLDLVCKDVASQGCALVSLIYSGFDLAEVAGDARNTEETALFVHPVAHFAYGDVFLVHNKGNDSRVDSAATRTHDNSFKRGEAHRGVDAFTCVYRTDRGAVAEVAGDDLCIGISEIFDSLARNVAVGGTVEAVAADIVFLCNVIVDGVGVCFGRHSLVESGVHNYYLRSGRHNLHTAPDTQKVRTGVKRSEIAAFLEIGENALVNLDALDKPRTAVDYAVADCGNLGHIRNNAVLLIGKSFDKNAYSLSVSRHRNLSYVFILTVGGVCENAVDTDAVAVALCHYRMGIHIKKLIFERGTARVYNQNIHNRLLIDFFYFFYYTTFNNELQGIFWQMSGIKSYVSVICEYNPFHRGHKYQLDRLRAHFDGIVCIMSGDLVQRGSVAVANKYLRAEAALRSGADLVLELPIPWCCSSARDFAAAGVHIADKIGSHSLGFGAEDGLEILSPIFEYIQSDSAKERVASLVEEKRNLSYPAALSVAVGEKFGEEAKNNIEKPNNILALEYLSALKGRNIKPFVVKREMGFESSSAIRAKGDANEVLSSLPETSRSVFEKACGNVFPRDARKMDSFFIGMLRRMSYDKSMPKNLYSVTDDLYKKIISESVKASDIDELVYACSDRIYTAARVRRAINSMVFGIEGDRVKSMPPYTCVLAANAIGREILRNIKSGEGIDIITKPVKALSASEATKNAFRFAKGVEDVISLSDPCPEPADKGRTPIIL